MQLEGRTALVTGAGRGLGRAIAIALAAEGADLILASRTTAQLDATAAAVREFGRAALAVATDVGSAQAVQELGGAVRSSDLHDPDIIVNNAGNLLYKPLVPLPGAAADRAPGFTSAIGDDEWRDIMRTHVDGAFHTLREFGPAMLGRSYGRVINVASNVVNRTVPFTIAYDVAKGALVQLTRSVANEWARFGVTVNAIAAGHFPTDMTALQFSDPGLHERMLRRVPMRRSGGAEELAALVVFLAGESSAYLTGQVINLDGGETL